jgi:hypothetical protein
LCACRGFLVDKVANPLRSPFAHLHAEQTGSLRDGELHFEALKGNRTKLSVLSQQVQQRHAVGVVTEVTRMPHAGLTVREIDAPLVKAS